MQLSSKFSKDLVSQNIELIQQADINRKLKAVFNAKKPQIATETENIPKTI